MNKCLICESKYKSFVDYGDMPIANSFSAKEELVIAQSKITALDSTHYEKL